MDDEQVISERSFSAEDVDQLLEFISDLDHVPSEIGNVSNGDDTDCEFKTELAAPQEIIDPGLGLPIPHITISLPEFMGGEQVMPQINISFSNLPSAPVPVPDISESFQEGQMSMKKHNFIHKLYLATNSQQVTFLNWSEDGQLLQLDYIGLQEHLSGSRSMFRSRNVQEFNRHIVDIGFKRVIKELDPLGDRPQLFYEHMFFKPGEPNLLLMLYSPQCELSPTLPTPRINLPKNFLSHDSESKSLTPHSQLQLARCRLQALVHYHNNVRLLQQLEPNVDKFLPRRGRITSSRQPPQVLTPSLATRYVNPKDSVLQFEVGHVPEYAGFYGRVEPALEGILKLSTFLLQCFLFS